ncbi:MAG: LysM peptidoglycan-binding domain-containing protein, partial [Patescibacteria group bacterium]
MNDARLSQAPACPGGTLYIIRPGDTFFALAARFNTTVAALIAANPGVDPNNLQIGQVLCIPGAPGFCPGGTAYAVRPGDTYFLIAQRFGVSVQALIAANPGVDPNNLQVGQVICVLVAPPTRALCCTTLPLVGEIPISQLFPGGVALIKPAATATEAVSVTFAASGLPEPSAFGDFNAYLGQLATPAPGPDEPPGIYGVILARVQEAPGEPVTWAGTRVVPEQIPSNSSLEIRAINTAIGRGGVAILRSAGEA